jgi:hypothetical protein
MDGEEGQPPLFPQSDYQAHQVDSQALLAHYRALQCHLRHVMPPTHRTEPSDKDMLDDLHWHHRNFNDFPSPLHPSPSQVGTTVRTNFHGMLHPLGGSHPHPGEAVVAPLSQFLTGRPLPGRGFIARHSRRPTGVETRLQVTNPSLQLGNDRQ